MSEEVDLVERLRARAEKFKAFAKESLSSSNASLAIKDKALRPFAEFLAALTIHEGDWPADESTWTRELFIDGIRHSLTYGDLRRAAQARSRTTRGTDGA